VHVPAAPPSRFVWLFAPTASPPAPPLSDDEVGAACEFAYENWRILPAILPRLEKWLDKYDAEPLLQPVRERAVAARALAELEAVCQDRLSQELWRRRVPHAFLKSSAIRWFAYADPHARCGWDIDVGVAEARLGDARDIAHHLGYIQAEGFVDPPWFRPANPERVAAVERDHYELGFLVRRVRMRDLMPAVEKAIRAHVAAGGRTSWHLTSEGDVACYVTLDIHHGISPEISLDPILATSHTFGAGGLELRIPRPAWLLMHLVYKIYWEGVHDYATGGYQYADLCRLVPKIADEEVAFFRLIAARWHLEAAAHYVLRRLTPEFSLPLSGALQKLVNDTSIPNGELNPIEQNDLGDMWAKLWGTR
jgi:hypothetical protein